MKSVMRFGTAAAFSQGTRAILRQGEGGRDSQGIARALGAARRIVKSDRHFCSDAAFFYAKAQFLDGRRGGNQRGSQGRVQGTGCKS